MKRILSVLLIFVIITVLTACGPSPTPVSSAPGEESAASTSESAASVTSSTPAESSGSSSLASQPVRSSSAASSSQISGSNSVSSAPPICVLYAPKMFKTNEELFDYLNTVDLREKEFDIIADEGICLIPRLVDQPKSTTGKRNCNKTKISTAKGGGYSLRWTFYDNKVSIYNVAWETSKKFYDQPIKNVQDLNELLKNAGYIDGDGTCITVGNRFFVFGRSGMYWLYEGKYVVSVSIPVDTSVDELILLAEDIVFDKHKLR